MTDKPVNWAGRTFGELTADEKRRAAKAAGRQLSAELAAAAPEISRIMDEASADDLTARTGLTTLAEAGAETGDAACNGCSSPTDRLALFPGGVCLDCWAKSPEGRRMPDADELTRMWGGKRAR